MVELVVAAVLVALFRDRLGVTPGGSWWAIGAVWLLCYLASCFWWPYRGCPWPWCSRKSPTRGDRKGNYRIRSSCWICEGRPWRRLGARLIGRG